VDNAPSLLAASLGTAHGGKATWYAIKENWAMIVKKFPSRGIVGMIGACSALDNIEMQAEVQKFFSEHQLEQADQALAQMLERLSVNVRLRENETARLAAHIDVP
jgi:DNA polymerase III delta subunit